MNYCRDLQSHQKSDCGIDWHKEHQEAYPRRKWLPDLVISYLHIFVLTNLIRTHFDEDGVFGNLFEA